MAYLALLLLLTLQTGPASPAERVAALNSESARLSDTDPEKALTAARTALELARDLHDGKAEAEALHNVAVAYKGLGAPELASEMAQASADRAAGVMDSIGEARAYNTLGLISSESGDFVRALEHQLRALAIRERINDKVGLSYSYNNLGNIYRNTQAYEKALEYHNRSLALKIELGDRKSEAFSHQNIGHVYRAMGDPQRALESFKEALAIREKIGDQPGVASSLNSIGQLQAATDPKAALATYERALALRRSVNDRRGEAGTYNNIGNVYRQIGDNSRAMAALEKALDIATKVNAPLVRVETLKFLSDTEAARGNYRAALAWHQEHVTLKDRLFNQQNSDRINKLQAVHESQRRDQQITLLQNERAFQASKLERDAVLRKWMLAVMLLVAACLALLYARYRVKKHSEARLQAQASELRDALARVKTLSGLIPICSYCKKIRDDGQSWHQLERYISDHSDAFFSHGICPDCVTTWEGSNP